MLKSTLKNLKSPGKKMAKYLLTNKAVEDLSKAWNYTFEVWSETQADRYYYMLLDDCQELADEKVRGKDYEK